MSKAELPNIPELPEDGVLTLSEYLAMQRAIGEETRYRVLAELLREGELSASELSEKLDSPSNRLHYHLDKLVDVGLVANRKRRERGTDGLYSYYVVTALGEAIMTHGVSELIAEERELLQRYA
ncbi:MULTISPECIES: winged helix-turn-helix domain-containing protein [Haloprofundus]|uniref:winged helix-turn-helix domain-containing protein n=1 Tax=Haloprofundus TaxID=1911573 RepID=UPI000E43D7AC|nr:MULTISPECIES: helix-turn-helix domain-containing protein [Haloprofundus]QCJ46129.1 helix-turn-helix transcriptional regulator [Haloprofundus sp. MHR1]